MYFLYYCLQRISSLEDNQQNTFAGSLLTTRPKRQPREEQLTDSWFAEQDNRFQPYLILLLV